MYENVISFVFLSIYWTADNIRIMIYSDFFFETLRSITGRDLDQTENALEF
jgi:hypothetical protein